MRGRAPTLASTLPRLDRLLGHLNGPLYTASTMKPALFLIALLFAVGCAASRADPVSNNVDLSRLYAEDQADTNRSVLDLSSVPAGLELPPLPPYVADDMARQAAVDSVLAAGGARTADDFYHAAMVMQHGAPASRIMEGHILTARALELDPDHTDARWLFAASKDRYLHETGQPQWYGTQFHCDSDTRRRYMEVDTTQVSDAERVRLGVPTLAEQRELEGTECGSGT